MPWSPWVRWLRLVMGAVGCSRSLLWPPATFRVRGGADADHVENEQKGGLTVRVLQVTQVMFWAGSLMSQVLQCTQFCALIWKRLLPSSW